ncbi:hypothetical protein HETIRDRAFT_121037 [Heterobasidion irregulare TC 32-1]|uniref:Uncharacterized protein n=1 Tax=Heterobasidion irregulare (strain TC 32-1) TaxID=747525 RepID=W4KEG7_HETIT|nr:uncharacterized protein HETIRDRAFT_121037 [Heterobasidion irregulare TC 32-1]ETW83456.1 hypothetical protein HETIRDRAFT_121037 [Heterobasidion irregulare TC 32-1]
MAVYYEVEVPCGMQDESTCYDISEYYPLLDEIYDDSKPDSEPRTQKWLVKERRVQVGDKWIWEWTPAAIDPHGESIRGDLQVILHPASRASAKHGSWKDLLRTIHAIWAVPYTPQVIAALQRHGQRLAPEVIVLPPIAGLQRRA